MISKKTNEIFKKYILEDQISPPALNLIAVEFEALLASQPASVDHVKSSAKLLKAEFQKLGITIKHGHCLEIASVILGYKNWNTASACVQKFEAISLLALTGVLA